MEKQSNGQEQSELQELIAKVDKSSEGWRMIDRFSQELYSRYFAPALEDPTLEYFFDTYEFRKEIESLALHATANFSFANPIHYDECQKLIINSIGKIWETKVEQSEENQEKGYKALASVFSTYDLQVQPDSAMPVRPELSE